MNIKNFELSLNGNVLILIGSIIVFTLFTFYIYRTTIPQISNGLRWLLVTLRTITLILIIFLLFEPLLNISWMFHQTPGVAILIDNSSSMSLEDDQGVLRSEIEKQIVSHVTSINRDHGNRQHVYRFADALTEIKLEDIDSLNFSDDGTDVQNALEKMASKIDELYIRSIVLLSDGNHNLGINPLHSLEAYPIPVHTIGIGDVKEKRDILITNVITNNITYANNEVPVDINFRSIGFDAQQIQLHLLSGDTILTSKNVNTRSSSLEQTVTLTYKPETAGEQKYTLKITELPDELTYKNNVRNFYVNVLKDKLNVLLISGAPGYDHSFIQRILSSDPNINVNSLVLKTEAEFYPHDVDLSRDHIAKFDCFIFVDYPRSRAPSSLIDTITQLIKNEQKPLFVIAGNHFDSAVLGDIANYLPFRIKSYTRNEQLISVALTAEGMMDPLLIDSDEEIGSIDEWQDLPPIYYPFNEVIAQPNSRTYLIARHNMADFGTGHHDTPVIMTQTINQTKVMALLGKGFWRWDFMMKGVDHGHDLFNGFMGRCIRWLVTREDSKLVTISTNKSIYRSGETIYFNAEVYDKNYTPIDDANLQITISGDNLNNKIYLTPTGTGKYQGEYRLVTGGDYRYIGTALLKNNALGSDSGKFSVEDYNLEFQKTNLNELLLQQIAFTTNGQYLTPQDTDKLDSLLTLQPREVAKSSQFEIWNKTALLMMIILLLSIEWFIRKRKGML
ncbi:hypothetical protein JXB12_10000 [candidate division KSB1 bacterium]|nr:hypothetical protein [candidate division KSB1 bacterium]